MLAVETILSDRDVHRQRLSGRVRELAIAEPTWEAVVLRRDEWVAWPFAPLVVDSVEPFERNVARVLEAARTVIAERPDRGPSAGAQVGPPDGDNETPEGTSGP